MVLTLVKCTQSTPSIKDACGQVAALAQKVEELAEKAGIHCSYGDWVDNKMPDPLVARLFHPSNSRTIELVWPYCNLGECSYSDEQIRLAVQIALIIGIGDSLDAVAANTQSDYTDLSLRHTVMEAQISAQQIIQQLVDARTDGVDPYANLYRLRWLRSRWTFLVNQADD